ncbi:hypothetical protein KFK09_028219 [Dendrobium nobile]|uniref:Uncharacterized protein n=1 Tax=Dendrobium nobile TaxID=94219 RepID=A0A8T3A1X6_DENNO|nr:hypothetical protein KFK09_028219 [Dendrobium nobile]
MQYIKYTISNTVAHWVRAIFIPKTVIKTINKLCAKFLFFGDTNDKHLHLISWDNTCKPRCFGGLGIQSIMAMQFAFNCCIIERFYNTRSPLIDFLLSRYYSPWKDKGSQYSKFWKNICKTAIIVRNKFKFNPKSKSKASIIWDHWCLGDSILNKFPDFQLINYCKDNDKLEDWIQNDYWCIPEYINGDIREHISSIPLDNIQNNFVVWDGKKMAYFREDYLEFFSNLEEVDWHCLIWHKNHSPRYSIYT